MQTAKKTLISAAAGIATHQLTQLVSSWDLQRLLTPLGLTRRRSTWPTNLAFLGAGVLVGGVTALLLAPSSGEEARAKLAKKAGELGDAASKQVRELGEQVRREADALRASESNNQSPVQMEAPD
jgi:hypothetical protein